MLDDIAGANKRKGFGSDIFEEPCNMMGSWGNHFGFICRQSENTSEHLSLNMHPDGPNSKRERPNRSFPLAPDTLLVTS